MRDGEISSLRWDGYHDGTLPLLTLFGEHAKTGESRQIPVVGPLQPIMGRRLQRRVESCDHVFHSNGKPFSRPYGGLHGWCYREWRIACEKAKLPIDLRIYDLRRSAIRNLIHAGVPQASTMKISGHRTADTFRRYMVEDSEDTANAIMRVSECVQREKERKRQEEPETPNPDADNLRTTGEKSEDS
jgi:integrase